MSVNEDLLLATKQLESLVVEILPQIGKIVLQDYGLLNEALMNSKKAIEAAEKELEDDR